MVKTKQYKFSDLVCLGNEELKQHVSIEDITSILNIHLKNSDIPKHEILQNVISFISSKLLPIFGVCSNLIELMKKLFPNLFDIFEIVIDSISRNQRTIEDSNILGFLNNLQQMFGKVEEDQLQLSDLSLFIGYGIKFLEKYFSLLKNFETRDNISEENRKSLNNILEQSFNLYSKISNILNQNTDVLVCQTQDNLQIVLKVLTQLFRITKILVSFNIILCSTTLKLLLKLSILNSKFFENQIEKDFKWLTDIIKFLCEQVHTLLIQFHDKAFEIGPANEVTKYLKVSSFFIQCLIKITEHFDVQNVHGFHYIIPVFFEIHRLTLNLNPDILNLIDQYLSGNILNLIRIVYKTEDFIGEFLKKTLNQLDNSGFCLLGLEIMDVLATTKDQYEFSVYFYGQFFELLFSKIPNCPDVFLLEENYSKLEAAMISLWFTYHENTDVMKSFEDILVKGILQYDLKLSKICYDIWEFLARNISAKLCFHYFEFWASINDNFPIICYDPKIVQVEYVIKIFYNNLPEEYKYKIWSEHILMEETRLIYTLGIESILDERKKFAFENCLYEKLEHHLNLVMKNNITDGDTYSDLVKLFNLLSGSKITHGNNMSSLLIEFIEIITPDKNYQKHSTFLNAFIKFLAKNLNMFDSSQKKVISSKIEVLEKSPTSLSTKILIKLFLQLKLSHDLMTPGNETLDMGNQILEQLTDSNKQYEHLNNILDNKFELLKLLKTIETPIFPSFWECDKMNFQESEGGDIPKNSNRIVVKSILDCATQVSNYFKRNAISSNELQDIREVIRLLTDVVDTNK